MTKRYYRTIAESAEGFLKEKGSKFIAYAFPVDDEDDVREYLNKLNKQYFDARHICYAWRLGHDTIKERANDDGEPRHSAGDPILGQIKSLMLTNTLVAVVRYFGGTKLGVGGLIAAYKTASELSLKNATVIERLIAKPVSISFDYADTNEVMRAIKHFDITIAEQHFTDRCIINGNIAEGLEEKLKESFLLNDNIKVSYN